MTLQQAIRANVRKESGAYAVENAENIWNRLPGEVKAAFHKDEFVNAYCMGFIDGQVDCNVDLYA